MEIEENVQDMEKIVTPLLEWYDRNARVLPWRGQPSPYRVWVSEIMLQQTRVEAVKPFFERFVKALPGIRELAECPQEQLLKLWEGLGYYNRVRNMQKAARQIEEKHGGQMPPDYEELLALPGIGHYTAGAIASIAFGLPCPAVDGNVLRVLSRVTMCSDDILKQSVKGKWEQRVQKILPDGRFGDFNQALMELGAMVCVPNGTAKCPECPLREQCMAHQNCCVEEFPKKAAKKARKIEKRTVFVIQDRGRGVLRRRPQRGLLAGMYELPNVEGHLSQDEALQYIKEEHFLPLHIRRLEEAKHIFSHIEWHMVGYEVRVEELEGHGMGQMVFAKMDENKYPIPAAFRAYRKYLNI